MKFLKVWLVSFTVFLVIDLIWLAIIARPIYNHFLDDFLRSPPNWISAFTFYSLFVAGLVYFALNPALKAKSEKLALKNGALFGFFTYMTYELTNHAVIEGWPIGIVPIDIVWGTFLGSAVSYVSFKFLGRAKKTK